MRYLARSNVLKSLVHKKKFNLIWHLVIKLKYLFCQVRQDTSFKFESNQRKIASGTLRKKCLYSELFWSVLSRIRTEYREIQSISLHSIRMRENTPRITPNTDIFHAVVIILGKQAIIKLLLAYTFRKMFIIGLNLKNGYLAYSFHELLIVF